MAECVYWLSLTIVIVAAVVIALHRAIPGDVVGMTAMGGVAVFALAGFDVDPPNWLVGFMASLASACVWAATRWRMHRTRCLLDEIKVGGTD